MSDAPQAVDKTKGRRSAPGNAKVDYALAVGLPLFCVTFAMYQLSATPLSFLASIPVGFAIACNALANPELPNALRRVAGDLLSSGVVWGVSFYIGSGALLVRYWKVELYEKHKLTWKRIMAGYNMVMAVYSLATCIVVFRSLRRTGVFGECDRMFADSNFEQAVYIFYLSKYVEFLDTYFLVIAGKPVSWLQYFHHAGAAVDMWILSAYQNEGVWIFVQFNSFIHTIMYFYYALTALNYAVPLKMVVTTLQLIQLTVGCTISGKYMYYPCYEKNLPKMIGLAVTALYIHVLVLLFANFYLRQYIFGGGKTKRSFVNPLQSPSSPSEIGSSSPTTSNGELRSRKPHAVTNGSTEDS